MKVPLRPPSLRGTAGPRRPSLVQAHSIAPSGGSFDAAVNRASLVGSMPAQDAANDAWGVSGVPMVGQGMESHFGGHALQRSISTLSEWAMSSLSWVEASEPESLKSLSGALDELKRAAQLLSTNLPESSSLVDTSSVSVSAAAASATIRSLLAQQGRAASQAANGVSVPLEDLLHQLSDSVALLEANGAGGHSFALLALLTPAVMAIVAAAAPSKGYGGYTDRLHQADMTQLSPKYCPDVAEEYFRQRPVTVALRAAQVAAEAARFGASLLVDLWTGSLKTNEKKRAVELRGTIERLGPAYIKVAQAVSTRSDLLTPAYYMQIQLLQDRVPPFPCSLAKSAMAKAFGRSPEEVFSTISDRPVAAASLGQVYRATLRPELGGKEVAVKVLRPGVLEQVSLDLYIMREAAIIFNGTKRMNTDWVAVVDEWACRFLAEMDYEIEARNAAILRRDMAGLSGIKVAEVVASMSTEGVLTAEWVPGEKLSESTAGDVRELCTTLLNSYLIQLLETGFLHADPHPGNLIRTPEGKICILDYGLMTQVTEEQRWALLEFIAHLSTEDWEAMTRDLQCLGFIPESVDPTQAGLVDGLAVIMAQLVGGGGAAKVNIDKITDELSELGKQYPFQIPPFFALILRAFSVIEGIALGVDPDYAIVKECFPYLTRRLLQDDSDRAKAILRDLLFGNKQHLDMARLTRVAESFGSFTTNALQSRPEEAAQRRIASTSSSNEGPSSFSDRDSAASSPSLALAVSQRQGSSPSGMAAVPALDPVLRDALLVMFGRRGSYIQDILVQEAVSAVDALSRGALDALLKSLLGSAPAAFASSTVAALGPLRGLVPVPTPVELLSRLTPVLAATPEDAEALGVVAGILMLLQKGAQASMLPSQASNVDMVPRLVSQELPKLGRTAGELAPLLPDLAPGIGYMAETFTRAFVERVFQRIVGMATLGLGGGRSGGPGPFTGGAARKSGRTETPVASLGFVPASPPEAGAPPRRQRKVSSVGRGPRDGKSWGNH